MEGGEGDTATLVARAWPSEMAVGIDAPRALLKARRPWYWDGSKRTWRPRRPAEKGAGRHAEVVIKALGLGNPQWTPLADAPEWMAYGFRLFEHFDPRHPTWEVFPSATVAVCERLQERVSISLDPARLGRQRKDGLDAHLAAWTALRLHRGEGWEVGDDGAGTIGLPARPPGVENHPVLQWPRD